MRLQGLLSSDFQRLTLSVESAMKVSQLSGEVQASLLKEAQRPTEDLSGGSKRTGKGNRYERSCPDD